MTASDPFDILGVPATFALDDAAVQRAYLQRSAALHPDHANAGGTGDDGARAAALNQAREVLADPERRAEALLRRLGGPSKEQDRSLPPAFLAEIMSVREEIEEDRASGDPARLERWDEWTHARRSGHIGAVARLFARHAQMGMGDGGGGDIELAILREIRRELNVWRYTERLLEQLDPDVGPGF